MLKVKRNVKINGKQTTLMLSQPFWEFYDDLAKETGKPVKVLLNMLPEGKGNMSEWARVVAIEVSRGKGSYEEICDRYNS